LRVLHVGDCGVRRMEAGHDLFGEPGYPLFAAEELLHADITIEFQHYFCVSFEKLPAISRLGERVDTRRAPDLLLVQIGSAYTRKIILPDSTRVHQLRDELSRRFPRLVPVFYGVLRPCLRLFGRHSARYRGSDRLAEFVLAVQREWPELRVVLVTPFRRSPGYASGEPVAARIEADLVSLARRPRVEVFDANDALGRDPGLRCVTGYNLNGRGCEIVGAELADWIRMRVAAPGERVGATAV
jgi:hypothetical protein